MMIDYTLVIGVDAKHLDQLSLVWPTWRKHKPSLLDHPMIVFYDTSQVKPVDIAKVLDHPNFTVCPWPPKDVVYGGDDNDRISNPRRYMMLAGFVYVPGRTVKTSHWLKLDTDVAAHRMDDWIDPDWFQDDPAVVSAGWPYSKPADIMLQQDRWAEKNDKVVGSVFTEPPLNLVPNPGSETLKHKRIGSWCSFWDTEFTQTCAQLAEITCGLGKLPVPSQDSYLWYCAKRMGREVVRMNMKKMGWELWHTRGNIADSVRRAMETDNG